MEFVDYYATLQLPRNARPKKVQEAFEDFMQQPDPLRFDICLKAYDTLKNPYKRARYNKTFGYLLIIQVMPKTYLNAVCCQLNSIQPYSSLQAVIKKFKTWIFKKYNLDWQEAQSANYSYTLDNSEDKPWLLLRFPAASQLESFNLLLINQKVIKKPHAQP